MRCWPAPALGIGAVLLLVSPADLAVYLSALQGLAGADLSGLQRLLVNALLIAAVDICILAPLGIYVAMPHRAAHLLTALVPDWPPISARSPHGAWSSSAFSSSSAAR